VTHRPPNVPQQYAIQALHAQYALHARWFFLDGFVSCENKGPVIQIPKLKVASSSLIARSIFRKPFRTLNVIVRNKYEDDPVVLAEWTSAHHIEQSPLRKRATAPPAPLPTPAP